MRLVGRWEVDAGVDSDAMMDVMTRRPWWMLQIYEDGGLVEMDIG